VRVEFPSLIPSVRDPHPTCGIGTHRSSRTPWIVWPPWTARALHIPRRTSRRNRMNKLKKVVPGAVLCLGLSLPGCEANYGDTDPCMGRCTTGQVCSSQGTCLADCRETGLCPAGLTCDSATGLCGGNGTPPPDSGSLPPQGTDGGALQADASLPPPPPPGDSGLPPPPPPPPDGGVGDLPPPLGDGPLKPCTTAAQCAPGQVCASPPGVCLPDCRVIGGCPPHVPVCNQQTGVCQPS
jgi:hypothetical protein